ncbi:PREDICTED: two-component response regulator-like APRR5 [Tarenaya hassleriana]|uniref:two-component response regulator-like APRR5 n=1 Tax=Tarenaya hassleriana TaxID=28532 RepID=UPI00053C4ED2|nr:PREDICTED: two-component response regulator-like APRR5 [Tarenaya hassleriana]
MGEVVVSSEEVVEVAKATAEGGGEMLQRRRRRRMDAGEGGDGKGLVKWERFLPKIALRVLLVEADDSTRQIVGALLRKCGYRVVAVADGLKAWEILKGRPESVDLILTEIDLPSISGYAFLTLIMEHEICKNVPVIMMSTQDSVSTVYKCMLKGAADYLVKPLRRNELRNLWRHVWRRQCGFAAGDFSIDERIGQQKLEATSENNSTSNRGNTAERPVIDKGNDAHSSCTSPELDGDSAYVDNNNNPRGSLQAKCGKSLFNDMEVVENETRRTQSVAELREACQEAIDFMGASFRRNEECDREESTSTAIYGSLLELDLSLRRSNTSCLWPSSASAFTRYVHRPLQTQCSISSGVSDQRLLCVEANQDDKISSDAGTSDRSDSSGPPPSAYNRVYASGPPWSSYPAPIPVKGIRFSCQNSGCTSAVAPVQSTTSPTSRPSLNSGIPAGCSQECTTSPNSLTSPDVKTRQREEALTKFRMKRKERCFEKKVRYESRKKLAEQRPRVKGQFVRHAQVPDPPTESAVVPCSRV